MHEFPIQTQQQISTYLKALRHRRGWTQLDLAKCVGLSQPRIAEIEREPGIISVNQLLSLLTTLGGSLVLRQGKIVEISASASVTARAEANATVKPGASRGDDQSDPEGEW